MARMVVSVDGLYQAVHDMVENNMDDNLDVLVENVTRAAEHARDELNNPSVHVHGGSSWRGRSSLSGGREPRGTYDSGWHVYGYKTKLKSFHRTVANRAIPRLTHLLEFGHGLVWYGNPTGRRVIGDYAIRKAYLNAAPIARGGIQ